MIFKYMSRELILKNSTILKMCKLQAEDLVFNKA